MVGSGDSKWDHSEFVNHDVFCTIIVQTFNVLYPETIKLISMLFFYRKDFQKRSSLKFEWGESPERICG